VAVSPESHEIQFQLAGLYLKEKNKASAYRHLMLALKTQPKNYVNIPDAPNSRYTFPTTRYKTKKKLPGNMVSSDYHDVKPEHSHLPLVVMLVLTQLSVGAFGAEFIVSHFANEIVRSVLLPFHVAVALGLGMLALAASILHLGRPLYAFRAILGLRTSWLSREILAFGLFPYFL